MARLAGGSPRRARSVTSDEVDQRRSPARRPDRRRSRRSLPTASPDSDTQRDSSTTRRASRSAIAVRVPTCTRTGTRGCRDSCVARPARVQIVHPAFVFPDTHAHGLGEDPQYVYAVAFARARPVGRGRPHRARRHLGVAPGAGMSHDHDHDHDHHDDPRALRAEALEAILIERGLVDPARIDRCSTTSRTTSARCNGAQSGRQGMDRPRVPATSCATAPRRMESMGSAGPQVDHLVVVENTDEVHNVVVCTLCSCYPWAAARAAAGLVQVVRLPVACRARTARRARRDGVRRSPTTSRSACGTRPPRFATWCCRCARRMPRRLDAEAARRACHPRPHDRRGAVIDLDLDGPAAPPRANGELVFEHPWQSRMFATTMALCEAGVIDYDEFRAAAHRRGRASPGRVLAQLERGARGAARRAWAVRRRRAHRTRPTLRRASLTITGSTGRRP